MTAKNIETMNFAKPAAECFRASMDAGIKFQQDSLRMMNEMMENWADFVNRNFNLCEKNVTHN